MIVIILPEPPAPPQMVAAWWLIPSTRHHRRPPVHVGHIVIIKSLINHHHPHPVPQISVMNRTQIIPVNRIVITVMATPNCPHPRQMPILVSMVTIVNHTHRHPHHVPTITAMYGYYPNHRVHPRPVHVPRRISHPCHHHPHRCSHRAGVSRNISKFLCNFLPFYFRVLFFQFFWL